MTTDKYFSGEAGWVLQDAYFVIRKYKKRKQKIRKEIAKFDRCTEIRFCSLFLYAV